MNSSCLVPWFSYTHGCLSVSFSIMLGHSHTAPYQDVDAMLFEPSNHWNPRSDKLLLSTCITWHQLFCYNNSKRDRTCSILKCPGADTAPNPDLYFLSSQCCDQLKPLAVRKFGPGRQPWPSMVEFTSWVFLTPGSKSSTRSWAMPKNGFCFVTNYCWQAILLPVTARTRNPPLHSFRAVFTIFFFFF